MKAWRCWSVDWQNMRSLINTVSWHVSYTEPFYSRGVTRTDFYRLQMRRPASTWASGTSYQFGVRRLLASPPRGGKMHIRLFLFSSLFHGSSLLCASGRATWRQTSIFYLNFFFFFSVSPLLLSDLMTRGRLVKSRMSLGACCWYWISNLDGWVNDFGSCEDMYIPKELWKCWSI